MTSNNPNVRPLGDAFFNDITRGYRQQAAYASVDFDLIPRKLTLTAGTRYSRTGNWEVGSTVGSFGCQPISFPKAPNPCVNEPNYQDFTNLNAEHLDRTFSGFRSRANLSWKVTEDALLYYTWSQGVRAGGFNRSAINCACSPLHSGSRQYQAQAKVHGSWKPPLVLAPDSLTNNELGWKTMWLDRRIQWNGAIYQENWNHVQIFVGAPSFISNLFINGGNYRVRGVETSLAARVTSGLSVEASGAWNHSELVKEATFLGETEHRSTLARCRTSSDRQFPNRAGYSAARSPGRLPFRATFARATRSPQRL